MDLNNQINMTSVFDYLNLQMNNFKKIFQFILSTNLGETIKLGGFFAKNTFMISVDMTEIYFGQFNLVRYLMCWIHFFMLLITLVFCISLITFDPMFQLIDNEFLPKNVKPIIILVIVALISATIARFDFLMAEWNGTISVFRVVYYLQEDIKSKHGLTNNNHKKLKTLVKICKIPCIFAVCFYYIIISLIILYISIKSNRITLHILTPFLIYDGFLVAITLAFYFGQGILGLYYYFLLFSQINDQIHKIYQKSKWFLTSLDRNRIIGLFKEHNLFAIQVHEINFVIRRTLLAFYIILALVQVITLNIILKTDAWIEKLFYFSGLIFVMVFGFGLSYSLSTLTKIAHKPYEIIYKIIRKPIPLPFKLKVTFSF